MTTRAIKGAEVGFSNAKSATQRLGRVETSLREKKSQQDSKCALAKVTLPPPH